MSTQPDKGPYKRPKPNDSTLTDEEWDRVEVKQTTARKKRLSLSSMWGKKKPLEDLSAKVTSPMRRGGVGVLTEISINRSDGNMTSV